MNRFKSRPLEMQFQWFLDVPLPHIIASDRFTFLLLTYRPPESTDNQTVVIEWHQCIAVRFGPPGEEQGAQWELFGPGYALEIQDSQWMAQTLSLPELAFVAESQPELHHYALLFTDMTFECIAGSFTEQVYQLPILDAVTEVANVTRQRGL